MSPRLRRRPRQIAALAGLWGVGVWATACGNPGLNLDNGTLPPQSCVRQLEVSGVAALAVPKGESVNLSTTVTDTCAGPIAGEAVQFVITSAPIGATLAAPTATTDAAGLARIRFTAGNLLGEVAVAAEYGEPAQIVYFVVTILDGACGGHCANGVVDCGETGLDCGGSCNACADPCALHCGNGARDCGETGIDCGGGCNACADPCANHCGNGARDCGETGTDCGGTCNACVDPCANHCGNRVEDCGETSIDCGGSCGACTDNALIIGNTLPSTLSCEANASATVTVKNTGTTTWFRDGGDGYKLGFVGDNSNPFLPAAGAVRAMFPEGDLVAPNAQVTFPVQVRAPTAPGVYNAQFQMVLEGVHWFGAIAQKNITVTAGCDSGGGGCAFPQGVPDEDFIATASSYSDTDPLVDQAVTEVMVELTGCSPGSTCSLDSYPGGPNTHLQCQAWFAAVNQALRDRGLCAGLHVEGHTDEIAVSNTGCGGKWYGYHVCYYGGPSVVWTPGSRRGWWQIDPSHCP